MKQKKVTSLLCSAAIMVSCFAGSFGSVVSAEATAGNVPERPVKLADILGATHTSGWYYFTQKDFLNEGADELLAMGTHTIKLWFNTKPDISYPYNSNWPANLKTMTDVAKTQYYKDVFAKPFNHYILEASEGCGANWKDGMTSEEAEAVKNEFYDVTKYLLTTYKETGKTFVLQSWEGDNALKVTQIAADQVDAAIKGMTDWLNARQDGITKAREEVGMNGVKVVGAAEVNMVPAKGETMDRPLVIDRVVPNTHMDLYSLSTWGTRLPSNVDSLTDKLDYIADKAPDSKLYGNKNVMLGEFGAYESTYAKPENTYPELVGDTGASQLYFNRKQLEQALDWGVVYALYWELYCNGLKDGEKLERPQVATNDQLKGVWLIRPDGTKTPTYDYFKNILTENPLVYYDGIKVKINGTGVYFDQPPVLMNDRTMVPMRKIFESLGAKVGWDAVTNTITAQKDDINITLKIDEASAVKNGETIRLDVPATLVNDRTMVPLRFISEAMGAKVDWDDQTQVVAITSDKMAVVPQSAQTQGSGTVVSSNNNANTNANTSVQDNPATAQETNESAVSSKVSDLMEDFSKVFQKSSNWAVKADVNAAEGLKSRVYRNNKEVGYLIYEMSEDITSWGMKAYYYGKDVGKMYKVYMSKDGSAWDNIQLDTQFNVRPATKAEFFYADIKPASAPGAGYRYLKIEAVALPGDGWGNQICEVKINN